MSSPADQHFSLQSTAVGLMNINGDEPELLPESVQACGGHWLARFARQRMAAFLWIREGGVVSINSILSYFQVVLCTYSGVYTDRVLLTYIQVHSYFVVHKIQNTSKKYAHPGSKDKDWHTQTPSSSLTYINLVYTKPLSCSAVSTVFSFPRWVQSPDCSGHDINLFPDIRFRWQSTLCTVPPVYISTTVLCRDRTTESLLQRAFDAYLSPWTWYPIGSCRA